MGGAAGPEGAISRYYWNLQPNTQRLLIEGDDRLNWMELREMSEN